MSSKRKWVPRLYGLYGAAWGATGAAGGFPARRGCFPVPGPWALGEQGRGDAEG